MTINKMRNKKIFNQQDGQSLIEILVALGIGAVLIGTASMGVAFMLRSTSTNENLQFALGPAKELLSEVRSYGDADWNNIYSLSKGSDSHYFFVPTSTTFVAVLGEEGLISNDVKDGLIGRWGFDESTGTVAYDTSGNDYNGLLKNDPTHTTSSCKIGNCLYFITDDWVDLGNLGDPSEGTIMFWFKKSNINSGGQYLLDGRGTGNWWFLQDYVSGACTDGNGNICFYGLAEIPSTRLSNNTWYHVAVSMNSTTTSIYLNGSLVNSGTGLNPNFTSVRIGTRYTTSSFLNATLDDMRIYNKTLSATEIENIYNSNIFKRYFYVENVCRSNNASSSITGVSPCADGSIDDPSTQKSTINVTWPTSLSEGSVVFYDYITRWKNSVFQQTDWSGGSGTDGPFTEPSSGFSTSSNVDVDSGSIRIHGL